MLACSLNICECAGGFITNTGTMARKRPTFVVASAAPPAVAASVQPGAGLIFTYGYKKSCQLPLAWITGSQLGFVPPLARMANRTLNLSSDEGSLLQSLLSDNAEERSKLSPRRGHNDEWYHERCVFCCSCKNSINSQYQKRGSRCHGCRRWFHTTCMPSQQHSSHSNSPGSNTEQQAATAGTGEVGLSSTVGKAGTAGASSVLSAAAAQSIGDVGASKECRQAHGGLFFHTDECKQVYKQLAAVAALGDQPLPEGPKRSFLPWQQQQPQERHSWRLLDLIEVRHLYKDAQRRGSLVKLHSNIHRQLQAQEQQQQSKVSSSSSSSAAETKQQQPEAEQGVAERPAMQSRLDDFMYACELLRVMGDTPKDLLEDSFALITRKEGSAPTCVATFNIYGSNHARLQGLATPKCLQRQGHATRLMRQLESVLRDTGLQQLTVIVDPEGQDTSAGRSGVPDAAAFEHWLTRLGYKPVDAEQCMLWRRQLPEYHKSLTAGCSLMVKPLIVSKKQWLW